MDAAFRELFVAYELLELALEDYHYDPDEGLEMQPEFAEELDRRIADYEAGRTKPVPMEKIFKKLGLLENLMLPEKGNNTSNHQSDRP